MEKEIYIHIRQANGRDCWINPRHIVRINKRDGMIEMMLANAQISDVDERDPENQELLNYLDLNRKKVL